MWLICERRIGGDVAEICSVVYCRYFLRICIDGLCNTIKISATSKLGLGHAVAHLVEALRYKPEGCVFNSR
jgi:hypothetical protein